MKAREYINHLQQLLSSVYDEREARNISIYLIEELYGKETLRNNIGLNPEQLLKLSAAEHRLLLHEPVQYVLGEAWFCGLKFKVNPSVLIPRPETEEVVDLIIRENNIPSPLILDIGTGSGCIPVILKKEIPGAVLFATDVSDEAIQIAKENAVAHDCEINFICHDILGNTELNVPPPDTIVSNPPYINPADRSTVPENVKGYEPALALYALEQEPLVFYRVISEFAWRRLKQGGKLYFEIPEQNGNEITSLVAGFDFHSVEIKSDMQGKQRMMRAVKK